MLVSEGLQHFANLRAARASLRQDGFHVSHCHRAGFGEVWEDKQGEHYAVVRNIPYFGIGTFVQLGHN